ncbi:hypothetical protein [Quadrisphaera sp. INWT6]|uniref:hypothetical protein n=1 Tax=Quadrisphaera sp. INWT6 TaxID=2596917 RepID=UPI001892715A|nr:hypothetical protein [Quadrisphaera sp. INWT6]MBF5082098.1 hypothetical protein [Quadrisphaera sp. INWT6]
MGGRHLAHGAGGDDAAGDVEQSPFPRRSDLRAERGRRRSARRAPRRWAAARRGGAGVALAGVLVAVVALSVLVGPRLLGSLPTARDAAPLALSTGDGAGSPSAGGASDAGAPSAARAVQALLDERASALLARDRAGWLAAVGGDGNVATGAQAALDAYRERTAGVFDRLEPVPLGSWSWQVTGSGPALADARAQQLPEGSWVARTTLVWSVDGAGDDPVRRQQDLTVVPAGAGWAVVDDGDGETVPDLWDLGAVDVLTTERAVVLGTADREALERTAEVTTPAAEGVDAVWGTSWPRRTVVEVPADQAQMAALLGRDDDAGLGQIAAVTTGELVGGEGATRGDHVVVNPRGFGQLAPVGQRVVLTHELTHVATRSGAVRAVPLWFSEGFADWVGYQGTGLSRQVVATDLLRQVRADGPPSALPTAADFDPERSRDIGPAYSGAWLAVDALARRYGDDAVVELYRAASRDPLPDGAAAPPSSATDGATDGATDSATDADAALDAALSSTLGTDRAGVLALWRAELVDLAG